ncbi:MAG: putative signal transducing protein [Candidatus Bipolaricaulota bacterium]|nr:DUF2007 domain-containing protein [Candidatus Bipolaricaulota bacterium]
MALVEVYKTWDEQKAYQMKELLGDFDISCYLSSHITHSVYPIPVDGLGEIRVMVPDGDAGEARDILKSYFPDEEET